MLPGKALGRLNDVARGPALTTLLRDSAYRPAANWREDQWLRSFVEVLADWDWAQRPVSVIALGSPDPARSAMVEATAAALAEVGRMRFAGTITPGPQEIQARNSAFRVNALDRYFDYSRIDAAAQGPILLVTDVVDTGWTVTVAAADLAQRLGADVLPLAFASAS